MVPTAILRCIPATSLRATALRLRSRETKSCWGKPQIRLHHSLALQCVDPPVSAVTAALVLVDRSGSTPIGSICCGWNWTRRHPAAWRLRRPCKRRLRQGASAGRMFRSAIAETVLDDTNGTRFLNHVDFTGARVSRAIVDLFRYGIEQRGGQIPNAPEHGRSSKLLLLLQSTIRSTRLRGAGRPGSGEVGTGRANR